MTGLTLATALACMLASGALFAFSAFVMSGLDRLAPAHGLLAMQSLNRRAVTGRDIRLTRVSEEDYAAALTGHGVPADVVSLLRYLFTEVLDGRNAHVADGVKRALGRPARDFRDYALRAAAAGAWR